jgi:hypothetical protein
MKRLTKKIRTVTALYNTSCIHDMNPVGIASHNPQVMGDEEGGSTGFSVGRRN